jgi:parallel beta-helix repeat protein
VALLAGLVLMSPLRSLFDRSFPEGNRRPRFVEFVTTLTTKDVVGIGRSRIFTRGAVGGVVLATMAVLIVVAGKPAREPAEAIPAPQPVAVDVAVDPATLPLITIDADVDALNSDIEAETAADLAMMLAENLEIEAEAMRRGEARLLLAADFGARLAEMQRRVERSVATGEWVVADYRVDSLHLRVVETVGGQGADLGFDATGVIDEVTYNADGVELRMDSAPFASTFVLRQTGGDRWLIVDEVDKVEGRAILGLGVGDGPVLTVPDEYPSIMAAVEAAPDGAVVEVKPGRYTETVTINRPLELRGPGDGAAQLVGDGQGPVIEIIATINVTIEGLAVSNGRVGIFVRESQDVVITNNIVENNELRGIHIVNASAEVRGNVIRATQAPYGIGIHIANASAWPRSVVENNVVEANGHIGISTNFASTVIRRNAVRANGGRGISITEMSVASVFDNEIVENEGPGILVIDMSTAQVERNTIDASSVLGQEAPIPVQVEFYAAADLIENVIWSQASCAISIGMSSEITGEGNRWAGNLSGCGTLPIGLFSKGG